MTNKHILSLFVRGRSISQLGKQITVDHETRREDTIVVFNETQFIIIQAKNIL